MRTPLPNRTQIERLLTFLPLFSANDFDPYELWHGGETERGTIQLPMPEYNQVVEDFFKEAAKDHWLQHGYNPEEISRHIHSERYMLEAGLEELRGLITYCIRGERFCDGHVGGMIRNGVIPSILKRLQEIHRSMN